MNFFLAFLLATSSSHAVSMCEAILRFSENAEHRLKQKLLYSIQQLHPLNSARISQRYLVKVMTVDLDIELGELDVTVYDKGESGRIEGVHVYNPEFYDKGLSTALFAHFLLHQPKLKRLHIALANDNLRIMELQLRARKSVVEAFRLTPIYKTVEKFGFNRVSDGSDLTARSYNFLVELEAPH